MTPFYIVSYYIKWVTTSWTYSREDKNRREKESERNILPEVLDIVEGGLCRDAVHQDETLYRKTIFLLNNIGYFSKK